MILDLPAELRLRIYELLVPLTPLSKPPSLFTGLLFSCRTIRGELEHIILKRMQTCLLRIQKRCAAVDYRIEWAPLKTFDDVYNLKLFRVAKRDIFRRSDPFMLFFYMYLGTFTIKMIDHGFIDSDDDANDVLLGCLETTIACAEGQSRSNLDCFHADNTGPLYNIINANRLCGWIRRCSSVENTPACKRIICDWSTQPVYPMSEHVEHMRETLPKGWNLETVETEACGMILGVQFWRVEK